ncbi:hypothetical protein D3C86_1740430 [compost metagenome]
MLRSRSGTGQRHVEKLAACKTGGASRPGHDRQHLQANPGTHGCWLRQRFERQCLQGITRDQGRALAVGHMQSWLPSTNERVVQCRQIVVYQGIGVHQLHRASDTVRSFKLPSHGFTRTVSEDWPQTLTRLKYAVSHGVIQLVQ